MPSLNLFAVAYAEPSHFSSWERVVIALLMLCSGAAFWARFRKVWAQIVSAKGAPSYSLHPIGKRIRRFLVEVMLQSKVIRERPLPGIAHALVFWGFCAFALVTLNHFTAGFGLTLLHPGSATGGVYLAFAALFAVAVSVAITGLFVRRFLVRPIWLGQHLSVGSAIVAVLILLLMLTYIGEFFVVDDTSVKALWWIHTIALLAFLPLIPHTKHLHLLLSPVTVLLSRGSFSNIPPLTGDEDFGLVAGKDVTRLMALQAYSCVECGRCTEHCPAASTGKALNPKEVILGMRRYLNELGNRSGEPLIGGYNSQSAVFQCTTCGSCEYQCPVGIEHLPIIVGLRRGSVNTGQWEDEYGTKLFLNLERNGNALGFSPVERDKFIQKQQLPIFDGSQEYCLWLGCMGAYDPSGRDIVTSFARVMDYLGVTFGVLRKERCSGDSARRLGNDLLFQQLAEQNLETLQRAKVNRLVSICPHCVRTISTDWKEFGVSPAIEHHSELIARYKHLLPRLPDGRSVVYHDPCYLGRYRDTYDAPREVIAQCGTLIEPSRQRNRSFCCGAGGGMALLGEESGERVSHVRAKELAGTGASIIGAACPFCQTMFRDALPVVTDRSVQVLDIAQIVAMSIAGISKVQPTGVPSNENYRGHQAGSSA